MSLTDGAKEIFENALVKLFGGVIVLIMIPVALWFFYQMQTDIRSHGEALARIGVIMGDVKDSQTRIETTFDRKFSEFVNVQAQVQKEIVDLQRAEAYREGEDRKIAPRLGSPN